ncbi:MAG: glycosyltransferase family 2 protein [Candidatus Omnitrophica bacterium]|nr:glycosyltransferase family 2 protein [Candidatus Omnitrophota bacterium]
MKVWVLIPAYNEEDTLGQILEELKKKSLSVLVVDDGSWDNTSRVAEDKRVVVIRNKRNFGKGLSIKRGIRYLLDKEDFDYLITMDADNQHSPQDLEKFLEEAKKGETFIIGNRMDEPRGMPKIRVFTNKLMSWFISKMVKQKIPDTQCGFRLIKRDILEKINIETDKYQIESEILIKAAKRGVRIKSIPIKSIYFKNAKSKINPIMDTIRFLKFIFFLNEGK